MPPAFLPSDVMYGACYFSVWVSWFVVVTRYASSCVTTTGNMGLPAISLSPPVSAQMRITGIDLVSKERERDLRGRKKGGRKRDDKREISLIISTDRRLAARLDHCLEAIESDPRNRLVLRDREICQAGVVADVRRHRVAVDVRRPFPL